uniref:Uncharacterized protein n=1 Tax=Acrobeloides nanus TaxID=290746 RepID=A0A914EGJ7_9BILA
MNEYTSVPIEPILENQVNLFPEDVKNRNFEKFIPRLEFTKRGFKLCHWLSQMIMFFGFLIFCLFYFIVYPNVHFEPVDPDCLKENAEWSAEIP